MSKIAETKTLSILIADDNTQARRYLRTILECWASVRVCGEAVDGLDAIKKAKELQPDLIVLDHSMPQMDGLAAARELRSMNVEVPIILLALFADTIAPAAVKSAGITAVFSKEDVPSFMKHVESLLRSS